MDIGQSGGPLLTGIIVAGIGYGAGFFASCAIALVVCVVFILSVRDPPGRDSEDAGQAP
jgi:hypothetical protein